MTTSTNPGASTDSGQLPTSRGGAELDAFKAQQKAMWAGFGALQNHTSVAAAALVRFAGVRTGQRVLDVATGTGVVALTAARTGAQAHGIDLTPGLVAQAKQNAALTGLDATFSEGDAERLDFADASFDVVLSQFGHVFAPRPAVALAEMLRVLAPGGVIAFSTFPPELLFGQTLTICRTFGAPLAADAAGADDVPEAWGEPALVRRRLGDAVESITFARGALSLPLISVQHYRVFIEHGFGPGLVAFARLAGDPAAAEAMRRALEDACAPHFADNVARQDFLMTRARKR